MKSVYKWATITTLIVTVFLLLMLILFVKTEETLIFAIFSGVIASMIVMAISNCISWFLSIAQEKVFLKIKYTDLIDTYSESLEVINYAFSYDSEIPGVNHLISKYQELFRQFQGLFILHKRDKMPDYYKLLGLIDMISTEMKKLNNSHKVVKTSQEKLSAYKEMVAFLCSSKELETFITKVVNLQHESIIKQNKNSMT